MPDFELLSASANSLPDQRWDAFVATHPDGHLLQTSAWAELKARAGWQAERVALKEKGSITAGAQVLLRRLPWGQTLAYVPKGPLVDWRSASNSARAWRSRLTGRRCSSWSPTCPTRPSLT